MITTQDHFEADNVDELTPEQMDVATGGVFEEVRDALFKAMEAGHSTPGTPKPGGPVPVPYSNTVVAKG